MSNPILRLLLPPPKPSTRRVVFVATAFVLASCLFAASLASIEVYDLCSAVAWCAVAWAGMQGPGRWLAALGGVLLASLMWLAYIASLSVFRPEVLGQWSSVWTIDLPVVLFTFASGWAMFRILSLLTGIEIIDPTRPQPPRWSIRRWLLLMFAVAVFIQSLLYAVQWYSALGGDVTPVNQVGPPAVDPRVQARTEWILVLLVMASSIPIVPILLAGWMLAGKRWRWNLFPILGGLTVASRWGGYHLMDWLRAELPWVRSLGIDGLPNWVAGGILDWFIYANAAMLIPWMGYTWSDFWFRSSVSPISPVDVEEGISGSLKPELSGPFKTSPDPTPPNPTLPQ